jgi:gas vesicle protein
MSTLSGFSAKELDFLGKLAQAPVPEQSAPTPEPKAETPPPGKKRTAPKGRKKKKGQEEEPGETESGDEREGAKEAIKEFKERQKEVFKQLKVAREVHLPKGLKKSVNAVGDRIKDLLAKNRVSDAEKLIPNLERLLGRVQDDQHEAENAMKEFKWVTKQSKALIPNASNGQKVAIKKAIVAMEEAIKVRNWKRFQKAANVIQALA